MSDVPAGSARGLQAGSAHEGHHRFRVLLLADPRNGPMPALLVLLTVVTGVIDSVSILSLGRVFVANMTGNVVFVGFAFAGAPGFSLSASLFALAGFLAGASVGGVLIAHLANDRGLLLRNAVATELALLCVALALCAGAHGRPHAHTADSLAALSALAMGIQNAVARRLAVPDLTTTVLTMTLTGLAADLRSGAHGPALQRRLLAVGAMFGGALVGAELVLHLHATAGLGLATGLLALVAVGATLAARRPGPWRAA